MGQRDGAGRYGLSLSARNQQMEQDRAPLILAHHDELARPPAGQLSGNRQSDWGHDHGVGVTSAGGPGHGGLSDRVKVTDSNWQPWICILTASTESGTIRSSIKQLKCNDYFFTSPKPFNPLRGVYCSASSLAGVAEVIMCIYEYANAVIILYGHIVNLSSSQNHRSHSLLQKF